MITLTHKSGKTFEFHSVVDSVLGNRGWGTPLEWMAIFRGDLRPEELTVISKTTTEPAILGWPWDPYLRVRYLGKNIWANAFGLLNPGREDSEGILQSFTDWVGQAIVSIFARDTSDAIRLVYMVEQIQGVMAISVNVSCPNFHRLTIRETVNIVETVRTISSLPLVVKFGFNQDYIEIAKQLRAVADVFHVINAVRWDTVFPDRTSPLTRRGGGGVSGPIIFPYTLQCVRDLREAGIENQILAGGGIGGIDYLTKAQILLREGADGAALSTHVHHDPKSPHLLEKYLQKVPTWRDLQSYQP